MTYIKPQVLIHQQFSQPTNSDDTTLRAMIVGPNAILHRYSDPDEKALIYVGEYSPDKNDLEVDLQSLGMSDGGVVDVDSATLYIDNALEAYYTYTAKSGDATGFSWSGVAPNTINCDIDNFSFVDFDEEHKRYPQLPRDVQPGDYVEVSCNVETTVNPCGKETLLSKIVSIGVTTTDATIGEATAVDPQETITTDPTPAAWTATIDGTWAAADTLVIGSTTFTFVAADATASDNELNVGTGAAIVAQIQAKELTVANYTVTYDDNKIVFTQATASSTETAPTVTATSTNGTATVAKTADYSAYAGVVVTNNISPMRTDAPTLTVTQNATTHETGFNPYKAGTFEPTYIVTAENMVTSANCSKTLSVRIKCDQTNEDYIENILSGVEFKLGNFGYKAKLTFTAENIQFKDSTISQDADTWTITEKFPYTASSVATNSDETYLGDFDDDYTVVITRGGIVGDTADCPLFTLKSKSGYDYISNIRIKDNKKNYYGNKGIALTFSGTQFYTGQTFTFTCKASKPEKATGLILQNNLPAAMQNTDTKLDIKLLACKNIALKADNPAQPGLPVFTVEDNYLTVERSLIIRDYGIDEDGDALDCELIGGKMYFEFREWAQSAVGEINYCDSVSALDLIPGQLDPDNPVKYAVYKALTNSNGVSVAYTAVADPTDMDDWAAAFGVVEGTEDIYSVTPTSQDIRVLNQAAALIETESGAEQCRWKTGVFSIAGVNVRKIIGQNLINNTLFTTSDDGEEVKAAIVPQYKSTVPATPTLDDVSRTYITITSNNASFKNEDGSDKVKPGDTVYILRGGDNSERYTVNSVISAETLEIRENPYALKQENKRIEVWHKMSKNEQAEYFGTIAGSFNTRRIMVVAPDIVGEDTLELPGYYLAAAISGYKSGINAYQGMTRTEIIGFDDYSRAKPYFTESQLNIMAEKGVSIVLTDSNGTAYLRHALTTDVSTTAAQEEVITRDYDYVCKGIHSILNKYIGRYNATHRVFDKIRGSLVSLLQSYYSRGYITSYSNLIVQSHALLADRVEVYVTLGLPFPINNIEVYVTAQKG